MSTYNLKNNSVIKPLEETKIVTGIGARNLTIGSIPKVAVVAEAVSEKGIVLRSGGAEGSDKLWEKEYIFKKLHNVMEIYLPYSGFNGLYEGNGYKVIKPDMVVDALDILYNHNVVEVGLAERKALTKLYGRNVLQILGWGFNSPSDICIYNSPEDLSGNVKGGTRIAVYLARAFNIPCINLAIDEEFLHLCKVWNLKTYDHWHDVNEISSF